MMTREKRTLLVALMVVFGVFVWHESAAGHAKLLRAEPTPGTTVAAAPKVVRLEFRLSPNEELDVQRSTVSVWDSHGRRVDDGKGGVDLNDLGRRTMIARLKPIAPGTYTVRWKAVSSPDLDVAQGSYKFTVAAAMGSMKLPPLRIISPKSGAVVGNPVVVVFDTPADLSKMTMGAKMPEMETKNIQAVPHLHIDLDRRSTMPSMKHLKRVGPNRYSFSFGLVKPGRHTIRIYWAKPKLHKPVGTVHSVTITVR